MSRLRITLAKSEVDREVATRLAEAERSVRSALQTSDQHSKQKRNAAATPPSDAERLEQIRSRKVSRDLHRVLQTISDVRRVHSRFSQDAEIVRVATKPRAPEEVKTSKPVPAPIQTDVSE